MVDAKSVVSSVNADGETTGLVCGTFVEEVRGGVLKGNQSQKLRGSGPGPTSRVVG
ncbi:MAG: hypothetical protein JWP34_4845 [Massilia sp.]|jgi:hypothetical protein|nr:hypothetical protein [Massilia sp.]